MNLVKLTPWQSAIATLGSRYRFMFVAQDSTTPITTATVAEAKRVLEMRAQLKVLQVQLIGRTLQADVEARVSRTMVALQGEWLIAGSPAVTFRALEVYLMGAGANPSVPSGTSATVGDRVGDWLHEVLVGSGQTVGETVGVTLAGAIKPLFLYAVLGFAAFTLITKHGAR